MAQIPHDELRIVPLTDRHNITSFDSKSAELNEFLKVDALKDQDNMIGKTYLCFWKEGIAGFITLLADTLEVHAVYENDGIDGYRYHKYPAIKIARLAVDKRYERKGIGRFLLLASIGKTISISKEIGCRYITVDSKKDSIGFYEKHDFKIVEKYRPNDFPKMYLNIHSIISMLKTKISLEDFENK